MSSQSSNKTESPGIPIELLQLSARTYNALVRDNINCVFELAERSRHTQIRYTSLENVRGLGVGGIEEIRSTLRDPKVIKRVNDWIIKHQPLG